MNEQAESALVGKLIIGLTGNIATGKSAVMRLAAERGALAIDADKIVHELMDQDSEMQAAIAVAFGSEVRRLDGRIDRRALGNIVFEDPQAMRDLEAMVHPAVRVEIGRRISDSRTPVVFIEAIKLLESDLASACHQVWVTRCSRQRQLERLMVCRGLDAETAALRIKAQPLQEEKVARADVVIDTDGLMRDTEAQFEMAWARLPEASSVPARRLPMPVATSGLEKRQPPSSKAPAAGVERAAAAKSVVPTVAQPRTRPPDLQVRRARPSDIPSILLLMQKATNGEVKMKRADLLMALSERSYFIGQMGAEISAVMGWSIDSQVARIDQIFIYPLAAAAETGAAILEEIEQSTFDHLGEAVMAFLPANAPDEIGQLFAAEGYAVAEKEELSRAWQTAVDESQPEGTFLMLKALI